MPLSEMIAAVRWRLRGNGRRLRTIVSVSVLVVTALVTEVFIRSHETRNQQAWLYAAASLIAGTATLTAAVNSIQELRDRRGALLRRHDLLNRNLVREDPFVDRRQELALLNENLESVRCINCHGARGTGKSFLLGYFADIVNGHRVLHADLTVHSSPVSAALYFDLSDAMEFETQLSQLQSKLGGGGTPSFPTVLARINALFGSRPVALILDNVNAPASWSALGRALYAYQAARPRDKIILGSTEPVIFHNLQPAYFLIEAFDRAAVGELVAANRSGTPLSRIDELFEQSGGLPLFLRLLMVHDNESGQIDKMAGLDSFLRHDAIPRLQPGTKRLLAYISLIALQSRRIPMRELARLPIESLDSQVVAAERASLITRTAAALGSQGIVIHDLIRDALFSILDEELASAAALLMRLSADSGKLGDALLTAMYVDPAKNEPVQLGRLLDAALARAVRERDYVLLSSVHRALSHNKRMKEFVLADPHRRDLFIHARASELAGLGRYREAQDELLDSNVFQLRLDRQGTLSDLQFETYYLFADLRHLLNKYEEAIQMFEELTLSAREAGDLRRESRCLWGVAHSLRHQGRRLALAGEVFDEARLKAEQAGDLFAKVQAVTGATGLSAYLDSLPDDQEKILAELEQSVIVQRDASKYLPRIWKAQAQVAWRRGRLDDAKNTIQSTIDHALSQNDRGIYNLLFDRAEFERLTTASESCLEDYVKVLEFARLNGDRNIESNALLGIVSYELMATDWQFHRSRERARAAVLEARDIALEADIQETVKAADNLATLLELDSLSDIPPRLVIF